MSVGPIRVLLIGSGSMGRRHAANLRNQVPGAQFTFLRRELGETELTREFGGRVVTTLEALTHEPTFAVIANPSALHYDALSRLLPRQIPCYVEKPVVANWRQFDALRALVVGLKRPPITMVGCNLRFLPSLVRLRQLLRDGAIGRVTRVSLQVGRWLPDWRPQQDYRHSYSAQVAQGGGVVLDLIHELDAARWLFGEFQHLCAVGGHYSRLEIATEDSAAILLGRPGGPVVAIGLDYVARSAMRRYEIVGEEGTLLWDLPARRLELTRADRIEQVDAGPLAFEMAGTYESAMREFTRAVTHGSATTQDLNEGLLTTHLALQAIDRIRA